MIVIWILHGLFLIAATTVMLVVVALILKEEFGWFERKDDESNRD